MANTNAGYEDYNPIDPWTDPGGGSDSGGSGPAPDPPGDASTLQEMQVDEGATLALAYGQHVVAGNLVEYDYSSGPPAVGSAVVDTQLRFPSPMRVGPTLVINGATFVNAEPGTTANTYAIYGYTSDAYMSNVGSTTNETFFLRASTTVAALLRFGSFTSPSPVLTGTKGEMASVIFGGGVNMYLEAEL
jgi:hypothetical protein